ncbi:MAG: hypothetical protein CMI36_10110 [Owenweeksia sp.]|nr:hypothetical protein [Owenweeksia sp.]MBF99337.1 hypothetical protein [Owenweeksia sp.]HBF21754.1 O-antigen ligase domain-containing protein [Cryomorphaceae bacterium]HCQ17208.1 O-antigen ligase domain-containing protein [Cryomorphaceae bacterium]
MGRLFTSDLIKYVISALMAAVTGYLMVTKGLIVAGAAVAIPFMIIFFVIFFRFPKFGIYFVLIMSFILPILGRYVPSSFPFGLTIDIVLVFTYVVLALKHWKKVDFSLAANEVVLLMAIWMAYIILQIFNPQAYSFAAWFYSMRGVALYQLLLVGLCFILFTDRKDWFQFFNIWLGMSVFAILWAMKQKFFGVDSYEQRWLDEGAAVTHVLFGKLRIFSYYFDAGTFGAAMGQISIMSFILCLGPWSMGRRIFYVVLGLFSFYALMLSGTRGALAVPGIGGILYLIMTRNFRMLSIGGAILLSAFIFLKYTTIGNANYDINRLRTALDPKDASLNTRLRNRARLTEYLRDKPFGGGMGTVGSWGQRFSPGTWLANFEPDGLYTRIRAETGLIGRIFYVGMWIFILVRGVMFMWRFPDMERRNISMAILAGYAGILMANYGNSVLTQFPVSITTFIAIVFVYNMRYWNEEGWYELPDNKPTPRGGRKANTK